MKKAILTILTVLAIPAVAGSIDWKLNTLADANYMVGKDGNKLTGTAYLLLTSTLKDFTSEQDIIQTALGGSAGSLSITDGINKNLKTTTDSRITPVDGTTKLSFTVLVYDSVNKAYFTTDAKEQKAYNFGADVDNFGTATQITLSAANLYATANTRGTQDYHSVPEPSVAIMGLLGLGMLLKRRRA